MSNRKREIDLKSYPEQILASVPSGLAAIAPDLRVVSANAALAGMLGRDEPELVGQTLLALFPGAALRPRAEAVLSGRSEREKAQVTLSRPDGCRTLDLTLAPVRPAGQLLLVAEDLTERLQLEDQLRQVQKLEAVGRLAGGSPTTSTISWPSCSATARSSSTSSAPPAPSWRRDRSRRFAGPPTGRRH